MLLLLSGLPLMVFYIPSTREAYQSIKDIEHVVSFGWWMRAAHRIAAHLMVIVVSLHLARVFLTGAYKNAGEREQHREWNWVIGVAMLVGTVVLSFTGYLLPWDQLAFWAVTVSMNIVASTPLVGTAIRDMLIGGREIGQTALMRFYLLHIVVAADRDGGAVRVSHVADPQGRRAGARRRAEGHGGGRGRHSRRRTGAWRW